jgi:hypothetical protein
MISIIPFRARHAFEIRPDLDADEANLLARAQYEGVGYTGFLAGKAIAAAGVWVPRPGIGHAWTIFTPAMKAFSFSLHREVKTRLGKVMESLDEVYAVCSDDGKWLKRLGFHVAQLEDPYTLQRVMPPEPFSLRQLKPGQTLFVRLGGRR